MEREIAHLEIDLKAAIEREEAVTRQYEAGTIQQTAVTEARARRQHMEIDLGAAERRLERLKTQ